MARNYMVANSTNISPWYINNVRAPEIYINGVLVYKEDDSLFPANKDQLVGDGANAGVVADDSITLYCNGNSKTNSYVRTISKVDLTNINTVKFTISSVTTGGNSQRNVGIGNGTSYNINNTYVKYSSVNGAGEYSVNVSSYNGLYYIARSVWGSTHSAGLVISRIELLS